MTRQQGPLVAACVFRASIWKDIFVYTWLGRLSGSAPCLIQVSSRSSRNISSVSPPPPCLTRSLSLYIYIFVWLQIKVSGLKLNVKSAVSRLICWCSMRSKQRNIWGRTIVWVRRALTRRDGFLLCDYIFLIQYFIQRYFLKYKGKKMCWWYKVWYFNIYLYATFLRGHFRLTVQLIRIHELDTGLGTIESSPVLFII